MPIFSPLTHPDPSVLRSLRAGLFVSLFSLDSDVTQEIFAEIMTFTFSFFSQAGDHYHRQAYNHCPG